MSAARASARRPNETLETPSDVRQRRQLALDEANAFDRLDCGVQKLGLSGRQREGEIVEDQRARRKTVLSDGDFVDAPRDGEFAFRGLRHSLFVDRQRDDRRTVFARER